MIAAILRAQLLSMRPRSGTRRGGAIFSALTGLIFYGFWAFAAWGAMLFFSDGDQTPYFVPALAFGLMFVTIYWQMAPVMSASFGASLDLKKLLVYPIPHRRLFLAEILLRIATCAEMIVAVAGPVAGLLRNPQFGWKASPGILSGALLFISMNILLSAGTRNWLERLFLRTRLREALILLIVLLAVTPQIVAALHVRLRTLYGLAPSQEIWPWAAAARLMLHDSAALSALVALGWFALAVWFSRRQFERSIRYDGASSRKVERSERSDGLAERIFRLPSRFLKDPVAAIVEKELRTFARLSRFRLIYVMSCSFGIVLYLPALRGGHRDSFFVRNALPFMSLYGLLMLGQIGYWNSFGFDRSATQGYFCWPIRFRDVLIAKNLAVVALLIPQILVISLICRVAGIPAGAGKILETIVVIKISAMYWFALGNIFSVRIPRALDPEKMNQMANKMQVLTIWIAPFLLLPLALAYWSRWFFESDIAFCGLVLVAAILGAIFYWVGLDSAVAASVEKRESMLLELSRADGPLSIT